jgi:pimeloyl-ACP methyl ester carboxylesterase
MITLAVVLVLIYVGLCAVLFLFQRSLIYFPQPRSLGKAAPTIRLPVAGADVLITVRPHAGPYALIYFGGNAEDVSYSLPGFSTAFPDYALYLAHYRGYGGSSGKPSETSLVADALALFDKVQASHKHILVVGRSLGSGVAVQLASLRAVERMVLVTPYDSIQELAARQFPYFPVRWLLRDKFESWKYAPQITAPTLLIAAEEDEVIPLASTESLFKNFRQGVAVLKVISGAGHNTISESPEYMLGLTGLR